MNQRAIVIGAVGLIKERIRNPGPAMVRVGDDLEKHFKRSGWLSHASFDTVNLILRFGLENGEPKIERINRKYSELEVAIELIAKELEPLNFEELCARFREATLEVLIAVGEHFDLDTQIWTDMQ